MLFRRTNLFACGLGTVFCGLLALSPVTGLCEANGPATTQSAGQVPADPASPRQIVERSIPEVANVLGDKSLSVAQKAGRLETLISDRTNRGTLARLMLGSAWDTLPQEQRQAFIDEFTKHLMGIYVPLMAAYSGQQMRVGDDVIEKDGDHTVTIQVTDQKYGAERVIATIACRMRRGDSGWQAIDLTVQGISIARVFAGQLRPVLAREGMEGLLAKLREKNARFASSSRGS